MIRVYTLLGNTPLYKMCTKVKVWGSTIYACMGRISNDASE